MSHSPKRRESSSDNDDNGDINAPYSKRPRVENQEGLPPVSGLIDIKDPFVSFTIASGLEQDKNTAMLLRLLCDQVKRNPRWKAVLDLRFNDIEECQKALAATGGEVLKQHLLAQDWAALFDKSAGLWNKLAVKRSGKGLIQHFQNVELTHQAVKSAWRNSYQGLYHQLLFNNINALWSPDTLLRKPYSNQIAIVQSSGAGKSRMVHEQAKLVFTIPFNLRRDSEDKDLAYPSPDSAVRQYFSVWSLDVSGRNLFVTICYLEFFRSVFERITAELKVCDQELNGITSAEELANWWSSHLEGVRAGLYGAAVNDAMAATKKFDGEILMTRQQPSPTTSSSSKASRKSPEDRKLEEKLEEMASSSKEALECLLERLKSFSGGRNIKLVIYFDEAHTLTEHAVPHDRDSKTLYDVLCGTLNHFKDLPIFAIFLSTNSSLAQFASPRKFAKSARIRSGEAAMNPPITETPFDCHEALKIKPGELTSKDISKVPYLARYGRPLYWTILKEMGPEVSDYDTEILELARAKLLDSRRIDADSTLLGPGASLAVLDVQLSLDFEPRRELVRMEEAGLVESHMRIAYSIPDHRTYFRSGYPSEPLIAEAAAQQLWIWRRKKPTFVVDKLNDIMTTGLLDRGELGELTGRQILLDAYHRAVEQEQLKDDPSAATPPNYSAGCLLITFIKMLFSDQYLDTVLDSMPDNANGKTFREAFKTARVCFTHFGKMADDAGATSAAAYAAYLRHMAIMCRNGQRSVDCIVPIVLEDTKLCKHVITAMLIQFKRRIKSGTIAEYSIDQNKFRFFPKEPEQCTHGSNVEVYQPYISLIMELGIQPSKASNTTKTPITFKSTHRPDQTSRNRSKTPPASTQEQATYDTPSKVKIPILGQHHRRKEGHARYNIFVYGCSSTVYRGINAAQKDTYAMLLNSRDFLSEHPRNDEESLKAVRRMKALWARGEDCYHWIEHDDILHGSIPNPSADVVLVGTVEQPASG